ncbi:MAG: ATP-binding protein [Ginsengibacter sp.]
MQRLTLLSFFILLIIVSCTSNGQTHTIDSLKQLLNDRNTPAREAILLSGLLKENESLDANSILNYSNKLFALGTSLKDEELQWKAVFFKTIYYERSARLQNAVALCDSAIRQLRKNRWYKDFYPMFANTETFVLTKQNKFKEALSLNLEILEYADEVRDTLYQMRIKNGIGLIYMEMSQNREAINWLLSALHSTNNPQYLQKAVPVYSNLAANYNTLHQNDSATYYIGISLQLATAVQNFNYLANAYFIWSGIYMDDKKFVQAEQAMLKGLSFRKQIGDPFFIVSDLTQIGVFYAHTGQPEKGIQVCLSGIDSAKKYRLDEKLPILYDALAQNYQSAKNYKKYAETLQQIITLKDSVYKKNSAESLAEMQARYDLQKKQTLIILQQLDLTNQQYLFYGLLLLLLFISVVSWILFKQYRRKQKIKMQQMQEEEKRLSIKAVTEAEEAERKRIAADLHDNLGAYAASIASNIDHLNISETNNQNQITLEQLRDNSQSIVSQLGDTIWALKKDALSLTAISDRIKIVIQRIQNNYPEVTIDVCENIETDHLLSPAHAFHLFQIMQEAINNALRHSEGTIITVSLGATEHKQWEIVVEDNGKGINTQIAFTEGGNGLINMQSRAEHAGLKISWQQKIPRGTLVIISPVTN